MQPLELFIYFSFGTLSIQRLSVIHLRACKRNIIDCFRCGFLEKQQRDPNKRDSAVSHYEDEVTFYYKGLFCCSTWNVSACGVCMITGHLPLDIFLYS